jgi:5-methylcytosine-specific restriction endonuclease McrA
MKHKRTEATSIPPKVKEIVWERDDHRCIFCKRIVPVECANAHYIKRSQGGLGIPENIFTACPFCHDKEDFGGYTQLPYRVFAKNYLASKHEGWNEEMLYYKKGVDYSQYREMNEE